MTTTTDIRDSWIYTDDLVEMVFNWTQYSGGAFDYIWKLVDVTEQAGRDYYAALPDDEQRAMAAEILAEAGWDMQKINFKKS